MWRKTPIEDDSSTLAGSERRNSDQPPEEGEYPLADHKITYFQSTDLPTKLEIPRERSQHFSVHNPIYMSQSEHGEGAISPLP